ncbi:MAG: Gfo/Idh/MocA family oxidoreductase, partial [Planctomycetes bacterium]|nr:Gfo/Idh/MocA family oxidoreductase [Planctomycetota bacterium]
MSSSKRISRRSFLGRLSTTCAAASVLASPRSARAYAANDALDVALVGVSGRGSWFVGCIPSLRENVVAMCDVNERRAAEAFARIPAARKFRDFRRMLDAMAGEIDAVVVATPDHSHAVITAAAMRAGKPVLCEKPLTRLVEEARRIRDLARECKVATQMGNQGTASEAFRRAVELVQAGVIGAVREVHVWNTGGGSGARALPQGSEPVPEHLDWDLWLGPARER